MPSSNSTETTEARCAVLGDHVAAIDAGSGGGEIEAEAGEAEAGEADETGAVGASGLAALLYTSQPTTRPTEVTTTAAPSAHRRGGWYTAVSPWTLAAT
jgi:hypothetical protein